MFFLSLQDFLILFVILSGETGVHLLGILVAEGEYSFLVIFSAAVIINVILELILYYLAERVNIKEYIKNHKYINKYLTKKVNRENISSIKEMTTHEPKEMNHFLNIFIIKLLPITKILLLVYLSNLKINKVEYLFHIVVSNLIWVYVLLFSGYLVGIGILAKIEFPLYIKIGFYILIIFIIYKTFGKKFDRFLTKNFLK